jgi:hypothetical protein
MITITTTAQLTSISGTTTPNITVSFSSPSVIMVVGADVALPNYDLYQKQITISETAPENPELNDLWLDIS